MISKQGTYFFLTSSSALPRSVTVRRCSRLSLGATAAIVNWKLKDMVLSCDYARPLAFQGVSVCTAKFECQWSIVGSTLGLVSIMDVRYGVTIVG